MSSLIGRRLGHYRIVEKIGAGGMGVVYRARDERLDRDVAIKVLPEEVAADRARLLRFEREAKAIARLSHPNTLEIHDFDTEDEVTYFVTELLEGRTLKEVLEADARPLGWDRAAEIGRDLAKGLGAAHDHGVVHRDIKPSNIFICADGRVKILDFGLASSSAPLDGEAETVSMEAPLTQAGAVLGTAGYMSPEQVRGRSADPRSDIFALGALLYEMVFGRRAFNGTSGAEAMAAILHENPRGLSEDSAATPKRFVDVIRRCLEKDPSQRFQTAAEVQAALSAPPGSDESVVPHPAFQRRQWAGLATIFLALLGVVLAVSFWPEVQDQTSKSPSRSDIKSIAILPLKNLTGDPDQQYFVDGLHDELIATFYKISAIDRVIGRVSAKAFQDGQTPISQIGRDLSVDALIAGSVRRSGNTIRTTVRLIDSETENDIWADSFQSELTDTIAMHREIAQAAAVAMQLALTLEEATLLTSSQPVDPVAQDAYFRGLFELHKQTQEGFAEAIALFQQAIEIDPTYAPAYAGLADTLAFLASWGLLPPEAMEQARSAAQTALELDDTLSAGHTSMAKVLALVDRDWSGAETHFRRAIDLEPTNPAAHTSFSHYLTSLGRCEHALEEALRAVSLDPLSLYNHRNLGLAHYCASDFTKARDVFLRVLEQDPNYTPALFSLLITYSALGQNEKVLDTTERFISTPGWGWATEQQIEEFRAIRAEEGFEEAIAIRARQLEELAARRYFSPSIVAYVHAMARNRDEMLAWLEQADAIKDPTLIQVITWADFRPYREDPRFRAVVERMRYPD